MSLSPKIRLLLPLFFVFVAGELHAREENGRSDRKRD
jgi:hypothetical protein